MRFQSLSGRLSFLNSSFSRLLGGFILVILIAASANVLSCGVYVRNLEREVRRNARERLDNLISGFDWQVTEIQKELIRVYRDKQFNTVAERMSPSSFAVSLLSTEMRNSIQVRDPSVRDMFLLLEDYDYVISSYGVYSADVFFGTAYRSDSYPRDFWDGLLAGAAGFGLYPAREFTVDSGGPVQPAILMPLTFRAADAPRFLLVVYLDIVKLLRSLEPSFSEDLEIYRDGQLLFPPGAAGTHGKAPAASKERFGRAGSGYEYSRVSDSSGLLFYKRVPATAIDRQIAQSAWIFALFILVSLAASAGISVTIVRRFNDPVKAILSLMKDTGAGGPPDGSQDLQAIKRAMENLVLQNLTYADDLEAKNSLLEAFFYGSRMRNIPGDFRGLPEKLRPGGAYVVLLFKIHYRESFAERVADGRGKAAFLLGEILRTRIGSLTPESVTLQTENDRVISVLNVPGDAPYRVPEEVLEAVRREERYVFFTIVVGRVRREASELHEAYESAVEAARYRLVTDATQVIEEESLDRTRGRFRFNAEQANRFRALLGGRERDDCAAFVRDLIRDNVRQGVNGFYMDLLATELINCCLQAASGAINDIPREWDVAAVHARLADCATPRHYEDLLAGFAGRVMDSIHPRGKEEDFIVDSVRRYVETHYGEEVYLDLLAEKLHMTKNYISAHFKAKTGSNLSDYISGFRIGKAKELMARPELKIKDIASRVGIANVNTFIRVFRKHTGSSPRDFRRSGGIPAA
jgi:two-component system, response regulator YesN